MSVRMGLHTGEPLLSDGGYVGIEYTGPLVSRRPDTADRFSSRIRPATWSKTPTSSTSVSAVLGPDPTRAALPVRCRGVPAPEEPQPNQPAARR